MSKKLFIFFIIYASLFSFLYLLEPIKRLILGESGQVSMHNFIYFSVVLFLLFLLFIYFAFSFFIKEHSFKELLIYSLFINFSLLLILPISSNDLYSYIYQSRVWVVFNNSPYLSTYSQFPQDLYFDFLLNLWSDRVTPYGPVLVLIKSFFTYLFSSNVWFNFFSLKFLFISINVINAYLIYRISGSKLAFYLYAFNPFVIFEVAVNAHNDVVFLLFILLSIYYFKKEKSSLKIKSYLFLALSVFTKFISLIFIPIFVIFNIFRQRNNLMRLKMFLWYLLIFFGMTFLLYYPFVNSFYDIFKPLIEQSSYFTISMSPIILLLFSLFSAFDAYDFTYLNMAVKIARALFIAYFLYILVRSIKIKKENVFLIRQYFKVLLAFFLCFFTFLLPWYLISLMAVSLLLIKDKTYKRVALFTFYTCTAYGIFQYIFLR